MREWKKVTYAEADNIYNHDNATQYHSLPIDEAHSFGAEIYNVWYRSKIT
jgi:hypothetical protein